MMLELVLFPMFDRTILSIRLIKLVCILTFENLNKFLEKVNQRSDEELSRKFSSKQMQILTVNLFGPTNRTFITRDRI